MSEKLQLNNQFGIAIAEKLKELDRKDWNAMTTMQKFAWAREFANVYFKDILERRFPTYDGQNNVNVDVRPLSESEYTKDAHYNHATNLIHCSGYEHLGLKDVALMIIAHESTHHAQNIICQCKDPEIASRRDVQILNSANEAEYTNMFDVSFNIERYVSPPAQNSAEPDLRMALYRTQLLERQAIEESIKCLDELNLIDRHQTKMEIYRSTNLLQARYNLFSATAQDVLDLIDKAQLAIAHNVMPTDPTVASIAYDIVYMIAESVDNLCLSPDRRDNVDKYKTMFGPIYKAQMFDKYDYPYSNTISLVEMNKYGIDEIKQFPQSVIDQNPLFMSFAVLNYGQEAIDLINFEAFDEWYFSKDNFLDESTLTLIAEKLGPKYDITRDDKAIENQEIITQGNR